MNKFSRNILVKIFFLAFVIDSCSYPEMVRNELVYENDFESSELNSIDGGDIMSFNNTNVIGDFNNDGLYQPNAVDKDGIPQQKCDESWSMDNIRVRAVKYQ